MASQVLSGSSDPSYTNNTGQNVRVVINFMLNTASIAWGGVATSISPKATIGRNLAFSNGSGTGVASNMALKFTTTISQQVLVASSGGVPYAVDTFKTVSTTKENIASLPTELMLAPGQTFSAVCSVYNIVVIPEAG